MVNRGTRGPNGILSPPRVIFFHSCRTLTAPTDTRPIGLLSIQEAALHRHTSVGRWGSGFGKRILKVYSWGWEHRLQDGSADFLQHPDPDVARRTAKPGSTDAGACCKSTPRGRFRRCFRDTSPRYGLKCAGRR